MKQLLVIRHGKAEHESADGKDFSRELLPGGRADAAALGHVLADVPRPDLFLSSAAPRALATAEEVARGAGVTAGAIRGHPALYGADAGEMLAAIRRTGDGIGTLWLCGHNPALSDLVNCLVSGGARELATASAALLVLAVDRWAEVCGRCASSVAYFEGRPHT